MICHVLKGVGRKVRRRELMDIASAEKGDDHVISLKDYSRLEEAVKKAVKLKIGKFKSA